jgi:transcriptional regulator with XRE-family HTH domain
LRVPDDDLPEWIRQHRREVGGLLRDARDQSGLTQAQLAERIGADDKTISRAENGHHDIGIDLVARLARGLDVPTSRLFPDHGW